MSVIGIASIVILVLIFLKVPVFVSLLCGSMTYFMLTPGIATQLFAQRMLAGMSNMALLAVPFFVCAGVFMNYSGVTKRVMAFCQLLTHRMNGGLAQVNVLLSTLMGGLSGSNLADAAMEAKMLVPEMEAKGYSKEFSTVITATSSIITPLIPPGIAMILYGSIANVSIGKLFIAGIGPGLLLCLSLMLLVSFISKRRGYELASKERIPAGQALSIVKQAILPLCLPVIIIGGVRLGIFTPTEAGVVAIVYSIFLGVLYKELTVDAFMSGVKETITTTASIMLIVGSASAFAWILTKEQIPQELTQFIVGLTPNKYIFLIMINIFLLLVGMFIEGSAAMVVLVPLLAPVAAAFQINEIQFAMVVIFNLALGCLTPPMGILMFVTCDITKCKIKAFLREAIPFYILLLICLLLLTFVPAFTCGIVDLMF